MSSTHPRSRIRAALVAAGASILLAGGSAAAAGAAGVDDPRGHHKGQVEIENFAFSPHKLKVSRGTKVVFKNHDSTAHTATQRGGFNTGRIAPGAKASIKLRHRGVYKFHCKIHPFMHGKIVVR